MLSFIQGFCSDLLHTDRHNKFKLPVAIKVICFVSLECESVRLDDVSDFDSAVTSFGHRGQHNKP